MRVAEGLVHGNAGRRSHHGKPEALRKKALQLVREHYSGAPGERFGPTLAAEHLKQEHGVEVDHETLRRWMLGAGLWSRECKSRQHRRRRPRKTNFGALLQMDGSFHYWLENRGGRGCLINLVDDATGTTLAWFAEEETTLGGGGCIAGLGGAIRDTASDLHGLEKCLSCSYRRTGERSTAEPIWADVRQAGY